jgi:hypothetical protein
MERLTPKMSTRPAPDLCDFDATCSPPLTTAHTTRALFNAPDRIGEARLLQSS